MDRPRLATLVPAGGTPACPACGRPLAEGPLRVFGPAERVVLPLRCSRRRCRARVDVVYRGLPAWHRADLQAVP